MKRKEITLFLSNLLIHEKLCGNGKYYASEVSLDFGSNDVKRVDFMQFIPLNQKSVSGLEKGEFISYEIKSCKADFNSGFGKNFETEKNFFVMPISLYKEVVSDIPWDVGVLCPIPTDRNEMDEFENPTGFEQPVIWRLKKIKPAYARARQRSLTELLFCMLRSGR